jgi:hypothetical protein
MQLHVEYIQIYSNKFNFRPLILVFFFSFKRADGNADYVVAAAPCCAAFVVAVV